MAGLVLLCLGGGAYVLARETSAFALRSIQVEGAPRPLAAQIRARLAPLVGHSLVALDGGAAARRVRTLPEVASVTVDRAFPHTLRVVVRVERAVAILRQADQAWLVSGDERVLRKLDRPYPRLPRIWLPRSVEMEPGSTVAGPQVEAIRVASLLPAGRLPLAVRSIESAEQGLTVTLRSGLDIRLGDASDLRLKLAVAARIVPLAVGARYVDVTVPDRAVAG